MNATALFPPSDLRRNASLIYCECEREPAGGDAYKTVNMVLIWIALPCVAAIGI